MFFFCTSSYLKPNQNIEWSEKPKSTFRKRQASPAINFDLPLINLQTWAINSNSKYDKQIDTYLLNLKWKIWKLFDTFENVFKELSIRNENWIITTPKYAKYLRYLAISN